MPASGVLSGDAAEGVSTPPADRSDAARGSRPSAEDLQEPVDRSGPLRLHEKIHFF